jgi:hypothetical protein
MPGSRIGSGHIKALYLDNLNRFFMMKKRYTPFALIMLMAACNALTGEEVGRLSINKVSTEDNLVSKEASVELKAYDEIVFWSDMDMEYEGNVQLRFRVVVKKDGKEYQTLEVDPTVKDLTIGETKTTLNDKTSWSYFGQNIIFNVQEDGNYTFKAILVATKNSTLVIRKAELVLKRI